MNDSAQGAAELREHLVALQHRIEQLRPSWRRWTPPSSATRAGTRTTSGTPMDRTEFACGRSSTTTWATTGGAAVMAPRVPWAVLYDVARFRERGRALLEWEGAGGDGDRLIDLDRAVRRARYSTSPAGRRRRRRCGGGGRRRRR